LEICFYERDGVNRRCSSPTVREGYRTTGDSETNLGGDTKSSSQLTGLCLKPNLTRPRATAMLNGRLSELRHGKLRGVLDFHIPFMLFKVGRPDRQARLLAIDAVSGRLDLYEFDSAVAANAQQSLDSSRLVAARLEVTAAREQLSERVMRMAFLKGFFRLGRFEHKAEFVEKVYLPYWVGIYERHHKVSIEVIDALRGRLEGAKVRELVAEWFLARATGGTRR